MSKELKTDRKGYGQFCTVARALDVIGDRWTILIIRELLGGPAPFQELCDGLPGIAKNLLTERLRRLESDGLLDHVKRNGAAVYALTEKGKTARTLINELGFWGGRVDRVSEAIHERSPRAIAMAMQAILVRSKSLLPKKRTVINVELEDHTIEVVLSKEPTVAVRFVETSDAHVKMTTRALSGFLSTGKLQRQKVILVDGDVEVVEELLNALGIR